MFGFINKLYKKFRDKCVTKAEEFLKRSNEAEKQSICSEMKSNYSIKSVVSGAVFSMFVSIISPIFDIWGIKEHWLVYIIMMSVIVLLCASIIGFNMLHADAWAETSERLLSNKELLLNEKLEDACKQIEILQSVNRLKEIENKRLIQAQSIMLRISNEQKRNPEKTKIDIESMLLDMMANDLDGEYRYAMEIYHYDKDGFFMSNYKCNILGEKVPSMHRKVIKKNNSVYKDYFNYNCIFGHNLVQNEAIILDKEEISKKLVNGVSGYDLYIGYKMPEGHNKGIYFELMFMKKDMKDIDKELLKSLVMTYIPFIKEFTDDVALTIAS